MIEHHIGQGVTQFILTNNRSTDRTAEIASQYPEVVEIIDEPDDTHNQSLWVTRMARLACKFKPDWIIHLDADEFWCGLAGLKRLDAKAFGSERMYLHPPRNCKFDLKTLRYYLDFDGIDIPGECKVGHRPDPEITITHGNHGFTEDLKVSYQSGVWRHHYPVRSMKQFIKKTKDGHEALLRRNSVCERWKKWYNSDLGNLYDRICKSWESMIERPSHDSLSELLSFWSTEEAIRTLRNSPLPRIGQWPKEGI